MGEARRRGTRQERVGQAIEAGRVRTHRPAPSADLGPLAVLMLWRRLGVKPSTVIGRMLP